MMRALCCLMLGYFTWNLRISDAQGEYCHGWLDGNGNYHEGFQCPEDLDTKDATVCCGTCSLRYCCAATHARIDQGACTNDRELENAEIAAQPVYVPFLLVGSIFIAFVVLGSLIAVYCCTCLRPKRSVQASGCYSLRGCQTETIPMILTAAPPAQRPPSRQSSTVTTGSSSAGGGSSTHGPTSTAPPCGHGGPGRSTMQLHQPLHIPQGPGLLLPQACFSFPQHPEPFSGARGFADFSQS